LQILSVTDADVTPRLNSTKHQLFFFYPPPPNNIFPSHPSPSSHPPILPVHHHPSHQPGCLISSWSSLLLFGEEFILPSSTINKKTPHSFIINNRAFFSPLPPTRTLFFLRRYYLARLRDKTSLIKQVQIGISGNPSGNSAHFLPKKRSTTREGNKGIN